MNSILTLKKNSNFYLKDELLLTEDVEDINQYMMQLLGFYVTIDSGVNVGHLVHSVFGMKEFIKGYFSEDYEVVRAFSLSSKFDKKYKEIRLYKNFSIESEDFSDEDEFLFVIPEIEFVESKEGEVGFEKLGDIPIVIDEKMILTHNDSIIKLKTKFTLLEVLTCIFDEMSYMVKNGNLVTI